MVYLDYNASTPVDQRVMPAIVAASETSISILPTGASTGPSPFRLRSRPPQIISARSTAAARRLRAISRVRWLTSTRETSALNFDQQIRTAPVTPADSPGLAFVWHDLSEPLVETFSRSRGKARRSIRERHDHDKWREVRGVDGGDVAPLRGRHAPRPGWCPAPHPAAFPVPGGGRMPAACVCSGPVPRSRHLSSHPFSYLDLGQRMQPQRIRQREKAAGPFEALVSQARVSPTLSRKPTRAASAQKLSPTRA
jgi:hypothetical protein